MRKLTLMLVVCGALLTAAVFSPAFERSSDPRSQPRPLVLPTPPPPSPGPNGTVGFAASAAPTEQAEPGWILASESQTMGSGSIDVALEAGTVPAAGAPEDEGGDDPRDTPVEDPFAGIGEGQDGEPVDEFATMSPADRAAAIRRLLEDDDHPRDAPDDDADDRDDPRDAPDAPPVIEYRDAEPLDEWAAMTDQERAAAIRKTLEDGQGPASPSSTLRTPPPKDPRAAAYDAQIDGRFAEVEAVRQRSNPPGAPIDPSGIAPVVSGEGRQLQELNLDPGLDAPLRDSRGTEVTRSTVLGLLLIRDMYIAMAYAMANVFDAIRDGDLAYKRDRAEAIYQAALEYQRIWREADAARVAFESERDAPRNLMSAEEVQQLNARLDQLRGSAESAGTALLQATDRMQQAFPEIFVTVDGVPLWKAMSDAPGGQGVEAGLERVQLYNTYLTRAASDLRSRAAVAQGHDTMDELMEYGRPEYANMRARVRVDGRAVGSDRADLLMDQVEAVRKAYDIHSAVDAGWTKVVLALTPVGAIAGGWFILPYSAVAYTCLGASVVTAVVEGNELVVSYQEAVALEQAGPIVGWRHVLSAQDRQRAATGGFVLAVLGVGVDAAVVRSIRFVGPGQCSGTGVPAVQQAGDVAEAARAAEAARTMGLRPDDIAHWRGVEAEAIERARGYGVVMEDATDAKLARMDEAVQEAEKAGIPRAVIDDGLNRIRDTRVSVANDLERQAGALTPFDHAIRDFRLRMVIAEAMQKELTIISRIEDSEYLSRLGGSRAKILILEPIDLNRMLAKAAFDRGASRVTYTSQEADLARQILNEGDPSKLYVFDPQQVEGGLYRLVHPEDLENLRGIFGPDAARPATIVDAPQAGPPPDLPPRQIDPMARTHLDTDLELLKPQTQVLRADEIGEYPLDAPTVRFPVDEDRTPTQVLRLDEIGEYPLDAPTVRFPSRALDDADRTPTQVLQPGEVEAGFREAETARFGAADDAADAARVSGTCPTTGPCGRNEIIPHSADPPGFIRWFYGAGTRAADAYEMVVRALGAENVDGIAGGFAEGRARVWSWPEGTSYLDAKRMDKFGGQLYDPTIVARMPADAQRAYNRARELGAQGLPSDLDIPVDDAIDAARLEQLGKEIYDETGVLIEFTQSRIRGAAQANPPAGATPRPPGPPSPPGPPPAPGAPPVPGAPLSTPRLSELDQRVIQKGFRAARNEAVEWTPEELTRLQQIAYPEPGTRPSAVQRKLMPVAEQLGGQMKTQRQDVRTVGEAYDQANAGFLAHQEMEDLTELARQFGVPEERIGLLTDGLTEDMPVTVLERASRGLLREIDQARGIVHEGGVPDDFFVVTRMYVVAKANGNRLTDADVAWLKERMDADEAFIQRLAQREFDDAAGQTHTIMDPAGVADLEQMYRGATGEGGVPLSQAPPSLVDPATGAAAAMLGGPSGQGGASAPVEVVILSTEGSTGPVMEAFFANRGGPLRIQGEGIVLEPITEVDAATLQRIEQIREAALQGKPVPGGGEGPLADPWTGASVVRVVLDAYCLEADLAVPTRGMLYRIADPGRQAAFGNLRPILEASERLQEQGALHPSNDPVDYFHSIRQWAIWADEKDMDAEEFEDAFTEHARRNITASGQAWTDEVEQVVRDYAPGRWADVEAVLEAGGIR